MTKQQPDSNIINPIEQLAAIQQQQQNRATQAERAIHFIEPLCKFHRTMNRETYISIRVGNHSELWPTQSPRLGEIIQHLFYTSDGTVLNEGTLKQVQQHLTAKARMLGDEVVIHKRVTKYNDKLYIDLGNEHWQVLEITSSTVDVLNESPVLFARQDDMLAFPVPDMKGSLNELNKLLPTLTTQQNNLLKGFILSCYQPNAPFPILCISGDHGAGKTAHLKIIRNLTDPSTITFQDFPRRDEDLWVSAHTQHLLAFDNVSDISYHLSDELCRISTGGSFVKRKHYEQKSASAITSRNPVILNGIEPYIIRHDLIDRLIQIELKALGDYALTETELEARFKQLYPKLFGGICKYLQYYIRNQHETYPVPNVRMRDAVQFIRACCDGNPEAFDFYLSYQENREQSVAKALENEPLYLLLSELMKIDGKWDGTSERLLDRINRLSESKMYLKRGIPKTPHSLGIQLKRIAPFLRQGGIEITKTRTTDGKRTRLIHIFPTQLIFPQQKIKRIFRLPKNKGDGQVGQFVSFSRNNKQVIENTPPKKQLVRLVRVKPR